jgi:putative transposase
MMAERGISVDHATVHRWTVHYAPLLLEQFHRRKRAVTGKWHVDAPCCMDEQVGNRGWVA